MPTRSNSDHMLFRLVSVFLLLALCIGFAGYRYYAFQKQHTQKNVQDELSAIADLKVGQITSWRKERISDANAIAKNTLIASAVRQFLQDPGSIRHKEEVLQWLNALQENADYGNILLVDPRGTVRLSTSSHDAVIGAHASKLIREALRSGEPVLSDFHKVSVVTIVHLDLVAPLFLRRGETVLPVGAILIRLDPEKFLYPLIRSWPGVSDSAETLIIRREGGSILYLNELRHQKNTALSLHIPIDTRRFPAALAAEGKFGVFEGIDYRAVPVLAATRSIPGTNWFLIAKVDLDEIYAPIQDQARFLTTVILLLIAASGMGIIFWWRTQSAEYARMRFESELERNTLSQQYEQLSRYANDIIILLDPAGNIVQANDRAAAAYGYTREELLRLTSRDIRSPEAPNDISDRMHEIRKQNGLVFETTHKRRDGSSFPVEVSSRIIVINGKAFFLSIIRDITERKQAEISLIKEKNRSEAIVAAIGDGISVQDREFRVLYQNQIHQDMIGNHTGELCYQGYEHRDTTCEGCPLAECFKDGQIHMSERCVQFEDGTHYFEITSSPLKDETGRIIAGIEAVRDITGRRRTAESLQESEERFKRLVESITDYIYTVEVNNGAAGKTTHGPGCVTVTGYTSEDYQADPDLWSRMILAEDREAVIAEANRVLTGAPVPPYEHRIIHKDGSIRWVRNTPVPRHDAEGRLIAYDGMVSDITQLKALESQLRQSQKMEAIGQLAGGVAHDFNNILTAIIGYGHLLLMKLEPGGPGRPFAEQVIASAERAAHLTNGLLAFSRKQIIDLKPVDLNDIIKRVEKLLGRVIGEDIEFRTMLASAELPVMADGMQVEQVLMNLAANARDAMPDGGVFLIEAEQVKLGEEFIRAHSFGKPGKYACVTVMDTGVGMDEHTKSRIFEPFFTTKEVGKGTGLGLSMVYGILKQHNGYITVASEPGKGTTFKAYFPLIENHDREKTPSGPVAIEHGTETILLAEDDGAVRSLTRSVLEAFGYTVIEAVDGGEAVQKYAGSRENIDLLVFDIVMPKKNGKEAYQEIQKIRPDIKVLFMSGYPAEIVHKKGILEAELDFILKPITPTEFLRKVREVLDK